MPMSSHLVKLLFSSRYTIADHNLYLVAGATKLWGKYIKPEDDLLMAFLPLAHILEQASVNNMNMTINNVQFLEFTFYLLGVQIGYASVKTLLDSSVRNCQGDFGAYKPVNKPALPHETYTHASRP